MFRNSLKDFLYPAYKEYVLKPRTILLLKTAELLHPDFRQKYCQELDYLYHTEIDFIPYPAHLPALGRVYHDDDFPYIMYHNKKLYFLKTMSDKQILSTMHDLLREQNTPPHKYTTSQFGLQHNSILIDAGAAEGNFTLEHIDEVAKVFLIEAESAWIPVLQKTFAPWQDKVTIIHAFAGNTLSEHCVTVTDILNREHICNQNVFLKIDVEGAEKEVLCGALDATAHNKFQIACCLYHHDYDLEELTAFVDTNLSNYSWSTSQGYALPWVFHKKDFCYPYFRKGMLYIE